MVSTSVANTAEAGSPHTPHSKEQGVVFKQNVAAVRDTLHEDMAPPSLDAELLSALPVTDLPRVKVLFLPYIVQRFAELSTNLWREVDGHDTAFGRPRFPER